MDARSRIDATAARIDAALVPIVLDRIAAQGEEQSGANNFYAAKARRGTIFSDYDPALAAALAAWDRAPRRIVEVGGGIGGFSMLAAAAGFDAICLEANPLRATLAQALLPPLAAAEPALARRFRFVRAKFPSRHVREPGALAVLTNFITGASAEVQGRVIAALVAQPWFVLDVDRFFDKAVDRTSRAAVVRRLEAAGAAGAPFLDLGESACFWRFRGRG